MLAMGAPYTCGHSEEEIMDRWFRIVALTLCALAMGMSFAHVLEWPAKRGYDAALYVRLQNSLYLWWGPPRLGGFIEPVAILAAAGLAFASRNDRIALITASLAVALLLLAFPVVFFWVVEPVNRVFRVANASGTVPTDWTRWRDRWDAGHAIRFVLHLAAFILLSVSARAR
jgi:hypothetical protein